MTRNANHKNTIRALMATHPDWSYTRALRHHTSHTTTHPHDADNLCPDTWDGHVHPHPLTFLLGAHHRTHHWTTFTFTRTLSTLFCVGLPGAGKTTTLNTILAQAALKTMPWDPTLHTDCHIIDGRSELATLWQHRPHVTITHGAAHDDPLARARAIAAHIDQLVAETCRRVDWMHSHAPGTTWWLDLDHRDLARARMTPLIVAFDDYPPFPLPTGNFRMDRANARTATDITTLAMHGPAVGVHLVFTDYNFTHDTAGTRLSAVLMHGKTDTPTERTVYGRAPVARNLDPRPAGAPARARLAHMATGQVQHLRMCQFGTPNTAVDYHPTTAAAAVLDRHLPRQS